VIFVSEKAGRNAAKIFDVLERGIISYSKERDTLRVNYELLKGGDQDETRFVLGKIIFDTLNSELACQENQHASMHPLSAEPIGRHIQDAIGMKTTQRLLPAVPENSVGATEDQFICQQNQNAIAMKKGPENTGGTTKGELIYQQNQKAITVEKRQPPLPTCPEISEDASEQICEKNQNAIATKKSELASRQKRNAAAGKKRHARLSSLFE